MYSIAVSDEQTTLALDHERLRSAVEGVLTAAEIGAAEVSIAIVDDPTIHELNRQYLEHDYPTDVLSFLLERDEERLEGEIVVSADTAARFAPKYGWRPEDELLLYVLHGSLHLVGYDDGTDEAAAEMRREERRHLERFGLTPHEETVEARDKRVEGRG